MNMSNTEQEKEFNKTATHLRSLQALIWNIAEAKGWHEDEQLAKEWEGLVNNPYPPGIGTFLSKIGWRFFRNGVVQVMDKLLLLATEVSEATEDYRSGKDLNDFYCFDENGVKVLATRETSARGLKPLGFKSELADVVIRALELCSQLNLDLAEAIIVKIIHNTTRAYRHGGKLV
jgi:NTP pyrophosphatase (non-canonical NTP hydrolase)